MIANQSVFIVNDTSVTGHHGCVTVIDVMRAQLQNRGATLVGAWPVGLNWRHGIWLHPGFWRASSFVVNGEGTIHDTAERGKARDLLRFARDVKRLRNCRVYLLNATIERLREEDFELLQHFDHIFVRESASQAYLSEHGVKHADLVPDLCFGADFPEVVAGGGLVVTDSVSKRDAELMNRMSETANVPYLPMRPPRAGAYINWLCRRGMSVARAREYYGRIAGAGVVATGRFHAVVFALVAGRPFVAVRSNTAKIEALLVDVFASACRMTDVSALPEAAYEKAEFSEAEAAQLSNYVSSARSRIGWMFDKVVERVPA